MTFTVIIFLPSEGFCVSGYKKDFFLPCHSVHDAASRETGKEQNVSYLGYKKRTGKDGNLEQAHGNDRFKVNRQPTHYLLLRSSSDMQITLTPMLTQHWVSRKGCFQYSIRFLLTATTQTEERAVCHTCKPDEGGRFNFRLTSLNSAPSIFMRQVQVMASQRKRDRVEICLSR